MVVITCPDVLLPRAAPCITCISGNYIDGDWIQNNNEMTQKRVWKQVRVSESAFISTKSSVTSGFERAQFCGIFNVKCQKGNAIAWNQSSDRLQSSNSQLVRPRIVPSRGNSTKTSLTRLRPGANASADKGVDIKHNSYARFLARKKTKHLLTQNCGLSCPVAVRGNKYKSFGILSSSCTACEK